MKFLQNPLTKRLIVLQYLRDELLNLKCISPKGKTRLAQLEQEIELINTKIHVTEYREIA